MLRRAVPKKCGPEQLAWIFFEGSSKGVIWGKKGLFNGMIRLT